VAERMGHTFHRRRLETFLTAVHEEGGPIYPPYSTDIAAAWELVEKLHSDGWDWDVGTEEVTFWNRLPENDPLYCCATVVPHPYGKNIPLAICRAALKALRRLEVLQQRRVQ